MNLHPNIPDAALDQHIAILGKTGSGKTYAAKGVVERLLKARRQVCVIDPTGAWWGLRLAADGNTTGYGVILIGGKHGDLPLSPMSGAAVARLVTEQRANVVLDTSGMTVGEYTRWFIDFAGTLYTTVRNPLHLVIDEAHYFMPQGKAPDIEAGRMIHAGNRLMSGGRSLGIRGMMITQRPAKLHKDSLTCADMLIAMRVVAPQDRQAIKDWIDGCGDQKQGKEVLDSLAQLERGQGWVWYPEGGHLHKSKFPPITTYDSSATPKHGATAAPKVGEINLDAVRASMAEAVKDAEANDPKKLRARIAALEAEARKRTTPPVVVKSDGAELATLRQRNAELARELKQAGESFRVLVARQDAIRKFVIDKTLEIPKPPPGVALKPHAVPSLNGEHKTSAPTPTVITQTRAATAAAGITARQQKFLDAAATLVALQSECTRETVCGWIGVHPRGGSVGEELKALEDAGYIAVDRGRINVTPSGMSAGGVISQEEAVRLAKASLSPRQRRIFEIVERAYPEAVARDNIAAEMGIHPRGGSFGEDISRLVGRGIVESTRGQVRVRDFFFAGSGK